MPATILDGFRRHFSVKDLDGRFFEYLSSVYHQGVRSEGSVERDEVDNHASAEEVGYGYNYSRLNSNNSRVNQGLGNI